MKGYKKSKFEAYAEDMVAISPHFDKEIWERLPQENRERLEALGWRNGIRPDPPAYPPNYVKMLVKSKFSMDKNQWDHLPEEFKKELVAAGYVDGISPADQKAVKRKKIKQ